MEPQKRDNDGEMHDIIGDIHGHADELVELLGRLGYKQQSGVFRHPTRQVIFCGDFVDRGPQISKSIHIVRSMCEAGTAQAVMGNHELNALAFHTQHPRKPGVFLREHVGKNLRQHRATLDQLGEQEIREALDWFRTLPVSIDLGNLRVVHACWDYGDLQTVTKVLQTHGSMTPEFLLEATDTSSPLFTAIERVMKGPEMLLPEGCFYVDKEGMQRRFARIRWFEAPDGHTCASYSIPQLQDSVLAGFPVPDDVRPTVYEPTEPPVFVGHYWLPEKTPSPLAPNIACVDYSVAKHGMLAAYRHFGEAILQPENFVTIPSRS